MALLFLLEYISDGKENTGFLHIAEFIVNGCAENFHRWRKTHVGIDQRRDIDAPGPDLPVEHLVVLLERCARHHRGEAAQVCGQSQRLERAHQIVGVGEVRVEEIQEHIAAVTKILGIHGELLVLVI